MPEQSRIESPDDRLTNPATKRPERNRSFADTQARAQSFASHLQKITSILAKSEIAVNPFHGDQPAYFIALGDSEQLAAKKNAEDLLAVCEAAQRANHRIHDDAFSMLWFMLKKFGLRFPSDLFCELESTDVVEIYGPDNVQMFRSFNMFSFITYSLEEIFTHQWSELWLRGDEITKRMQEISSGIFAGKYKGIIRSNLPNHLVTEGFSLARRKTFMMHRFFLPLHGTDGRVAALLNVLRPIERD